MHYSESLTRAEKAGSKDCIKVAIRYLWPALLLAANASRSSAQAASTSNSTLGIEAGYRLGHQRGTGQGFGLSASADAQFAERWRGTLRLSFLYLTLDHDSPLFSVPLQAGVVALLGPYVWVGVELGPTVWSADKLDMGKRSMALGLSIEPTLGARFSALEIRWGGNFLYTPDTKVFASMLALGWRFFVP